MVPKKASELVKVTSEELELPEELVRDVVEFYWTDVRKSLIEAKSHNIYILSLGTFKAKSWMVEKLVGKYNDIIERLKLRVGDSEMSFRRFTIIKSLELKIDKLLKVHNKIKEDQVKKQSIKDKRNATKN